MKSVVVVVVQDIDWVQTEKHVFEVASNHPFLVVVVVVVVLCSSRQNS